MLFVNSNDNLLMSNSKNIKRVIYNLEKQKDSDSPFAEVVFQEKLISSKLIGDYNKTNILAACEIGKYFGVSFDNIKEAIEKFSPGL